MGSAWFLLAVAGCTTVATRNREALHYGPYPHDYEGIVEKAVTGRSDAATGLTVTVNSVTEPIRQFRDDIAGWAVWARIRETRPNRDGGFDINERECSFILRNGKVVLSDYAGR